ncbi:hypothetical protein HSBAA_13410 [Vreelandella sulfidaeris]|uniref:NADH-rubredoxin oxidoreductase C-terminal domain-containing protein n=1 Tax=Vreelandella sulfidaeris TaxID=115553 RepID=A0A455U2J4_9GAMM|nr:hypothetical protein HSBAA_13410 [Halomonas sulfidaeris]
MSTKLKLLGVDVGSIGDAHGNQNPSARMFRYLDPIKQEYRKLVVSSDGKSCSAPCWWATTVFTTPYCSTTPTVLSCPMNLLH